MLIMIDGIDGSGKSSIVQSWKEYLVAEGNGIFDLKEYQKKLDRYPDYSETKSYDFIFNHEPSSAGIGKIIREEFIRKGTDYDPYAVAEAYALDRLVLYKKIVVPALADDKYVVTDRGVCTSLCYQSLSGKLTFDEIASIPGNAFTLKYAPDHLVIVTLEPEIALQRLNSRSHKNDDAIFEKLDFLKKAHNLYTSEAFKTFFEKKGTKVHYLPANDEIGIMKSKGLDLFKKLLTK